MTSNAITTNAWTSFGLHGMFSDHFLTNRLHSQVPCIVHCRFHVSEVLDEHMDNNMNLPCKNRVSVRQVRF